MRILECGLRLPAGRQGFWIGDLARSDTPPWRRLEFGFEIKRLKPQSTKQKVRLSRITWTNFPCGAKSK